MEKKNKGKLAAITEQGDLGLGILLINEDEEVLKHQEEKDDRE